MEPRLNSYIYVKTVINRLINFSKVKVLAKGTDIFFHEYCPDTTVIEECREPLYYKDYGNTWFKSLKEIRKKYNIKKIGDGYYEEIIDYRK